uniref:Bromo domain-containing protein n=1 Tax=Steinernema glaseri TaxID=37863 RepID=A0A1I8ACH5_9BILA
MEPEEKEENSSSESTSCVSPEMEQYLISVRHKMDLLRRVPFMSPEEKRSLMPMIRQHIAKDPRYKEEIEQMASIIRQRGVKTHDITLPSSKVIIEHIKSQQGLHTDTVQIKTEIPDTPSCSNSTVPSEDEPFVHTSQSIDESEKTTPLVVQTEEPASVEPQPSGLLMVNGTKSPEKPHRDPTPQKSPTKSPIKSPVESNEIQISPPEEPMTEPESKPDEEPKPEPVQEVVPESQQVSEQEPEKEAKPQIVDEPMIEVPVVSEKLPEVEEVIPKPEPDIKPPEPATITPSPQDTPQVVVSAPKVQTPPAVPERKRGRPRKIRKSEPKEPKSVKEVPAVPTSSDVSVEPPSAPESDGRKRRRSERQRTASTPSSTISQSPMATRGSAKHQKTEPEVKPESMVDVEPEKPTDTVIPAQTVPAAVAQAEIPAKVEPEPVEAEPKPVEVEHKSVEAEPKNAEVEPKPEPKAVIKEESPKKEKRKERKRGHDENLLARNIASQTVISILSPLLLKGTKVTVDSPKGRATGKGKHVQTEKMRLLESEAVHLGKHNPNEDSIQRSSCDDEGDSSRPVSTSTRKSKAQSEHSTEGDTERIISLIEAATVKLEEPTEEEQGPSRNGVTNPTLLQKNMCISILNAIASQRCAAAFLNPVTERVAPGYKEVVFCPRDINTLKKMVDSGRITKVSDLKKALATMYANALMYNYVGHEVNTNAKSEAMDAFNHIEETLKLTSDEPSQGRRRPTTRGNNETRTTAGPTSSSRSTPVSTATTSQQGFPSHSATPESSSAPVKTRRSLRRNQ